MISGLVSDALCTSTQKLPNVYASEHDTNFSSISKHTMANLKTNREGFRSMSRLASADLSIVHGPAQPGVIEMTLGSLMRQQAVKRPSDLLVLSHHQKKSLTYSQANERSDQLARGLLEIGVATGLPIAILMGNEIEYIEVFYASVKLGSPITLLNYAYTEEELISVLSSCAATTLIMVPGFDRYDYRLWLPRLKQSIPCLQYIVMVHGNENDHAYSFDYEKIIMGGAMSTQDLLAVEAGLKSTDVINLQFTSGSTGSPKASALTHRGLFNAGRFIGNTMYLTSADRICLPVPLFHSFGLIIGLATVSVHGASIILPSNKFDPVAALECIQRYRCTGLYGVTTMFVAQMELPNFSSFDLSTLRFAILAGSAVPESLMRKVWAAFGITQTHTNWGLTESSSICTMTKDTDTIEQRTITSGRLFPGFSAKIVDPGTIKAVPRGQRGEIVLRGYGVQQHYYANVKKTAEAHRISPDDGLEWFHTGDEGYIDSDGYFVITGRIKDMIIRGGENIAPLEIEERLAAHPAIAQSSVIGVPDEKYGEAICAFVEFSSLPNVKKPTDDELRAWVSNSLARFKQPKYIIWLRSSATFMTWPKTASGKLRKPDLAIIATKILTNKPSLSGCLVGKEARL